MTAPGRQLRFGPFLYKVHDRTLSRGDTRIALSPKVLETLELLLLGDGRIVSKQEFMRALWPDSFVEESNLTQNIFVLRKILGTASDGSSYIETIPKRGYRLCAQVIEANEAGEPPAPNGSRNVAAAIHSAHSDAASEPVAAFGRAEDDEISAMDAEMIGLAAPAAMHSAESKASRVETVAPVQRGRRRYVFAAMIFPVLAAGTLAWWHGRAVPAVRVTALRQITDDGMSKDLGSFPAPLTLDGNVLSFVEQRDNRSILAEVPVSGGPVRTRPTPTPDAVLSDVSQQTHRMLFGSIWHTENEPPILVESAESGAHPLGELTGHDASWSPSGDRVAVTHGRFLYVAKADGSNLRRLVSGVGVLYWPRWAPDGDSLSFSENYGSNAQQIWKVNANGSNLHQYEPTGPDPDQLSCGSWSTDGRHFFYLAGGPKSSTLWVDTLQHKNADWTPVRSEALQTGPAELWRAPLPSNDGSRLWAIGSQMRGELVTVDAKTRTLKPYLNGLSAEGVSYSPDGQWIAYTSYPEGTLWRSRPDGSDKQQLTSPPLVVRFPRWSPDGKTIATLAGEAGSRWRICLITAKTGAVRMLADDADEGVATWSPDGHELAFGRLLDYGTARNPNLTVEIYDLDHDTHQTVHGSQGLWTVRWSPDGRYIAAVTEDNQTLRLFDRRTEQWRDLAHSGVNDVVWTPDSRYVFFDTNFGRAPRIYRVAIESGTVDTYADLTGMRRGGFFSPWLGVTAGGEPLLLRDTAIQEIYELSLEWSR